MNPATHNLQLPSLQSRMFGDSTIADACVSISRQVRDAGGRALLIGGCVRDALLGTTAKDFDIEVYGMAPDRLKALLMQFFEIDVVGESFGVLKLKGLPVDVSIPRRESKAGHGHRGFDIDSDPSMSVEEAARRRDLTVNAMAFDLLTNNLVDPFGGRADIHQKVLRHTSPQFEEDPLRVLRVMQFVARFEFDIAPETLDLCRRLSSEELAAERVFEEWKKLLLRGTRPSLGLRFVHDCGWLNDHPELHALLDCPQDPKWHPEGNAWEHTLHVVDAFARERIGDEWEDLVVGLACLCHDLGKPSTTAEVHGRIRALGHEEAGASPTRAFIARMTSNTRLVDQVVPLVTEHMKPVMLFEGGAGLTGVRRLANRVGRIDRLVRVFNADQAGRPPMEPRLDVGCWLLEKANEIQVLNAKPAPIVLGRHLIQLGLEPGVHFGAILRQCFEAQLEGEFDTLEDGVEYARRVVGRDSA